MYESLIKFQEAAYCFSSIILILPGIILLLGGLCMWLGGLRWSTVFSGLVGAIIGFSLAMAVNPETILLPAIAAVVLTVLAIYFKKIFLSLAVAITTAKIILIIFSWNMIKDLPAIQTNYSSLEPGSVSLEESIEITKEFYDYNISSFQQIFKKLSPAAYIISAAGFLLAIVIFFFLPRLCSALFFSLFGICLCFYGMIMLLLNKGSRPFDIIENQLFIYIMVFFVMLLFGAAVQMILAPCKPKKEKQENQESGENK